MKDALEYLKFILTQKQYGYISGTLPRSALIITFGIACFYTILTATNDDFIFYAWIGLAISILMNIHGLITFTNQRKEGKLIQDICTDILSGRIITSKIAMERYEMACKINHLNRIEDIIEQTKEEGKKEKQKRL